jgi:hypothetical protein
MGHGFDGFGVTGSSETATGTTGFHSGCWTWRIGPPLGSRIHRILSGLMDFSPWIRRLPGSPAFSDSPTTNHRKSVPPNGRIFPPSMNLSLPLSLSQHLISHSLAFSLCLSSLNLMISLSLSLSHCVRARRGRKKNNKRRRRQLAAQVALQKILFLVTCN